MLTSTLLFSCCSSEDDNPCKKEEPAKHTVYYVSDADKLKIPFRTDGLDALTYTSDAGDTAILYGQGKNTYWHEESVNRNNNPACPFYDYYSYENIAYSFESFPVSISLILNFKKFESAKSVLHHSGLGFILNDEMKEVYLDDANNQSSYLDTVEINDVIYNTLNVSLGTTASVNYNCNYGVLKFKLNHKIWRRKL